MSEYNFFFNDVRKMYILIWLETEAIGLSDFKRADAFMMIYLESVAAIDNFIH